MEPEASALSTPKEGHWIARPRKPRWGAGLLASGGFLWQLPNILRSLSEGHGPIHWFFTGLMVAFVGLLAAVGVREVLVRRVRAADLALTDAAFEGQYPVEVTIVVERKALGTDRGVAWFDEDGLMGFSGAACSFLLSAGDLLGLYKGPTRKVAGRPVPLSAFVLVDAPRAAYVLVNPLGKNRKAFTRTFDAFRAARKKPREERVWPPLEPYDERERAAGFSLQERPRL